MHIEVVSGFSHKACDSCHAQQDCAAGQLVRDVEADLYHATTEVLYEHDEGIVEEVVAGNGQTNLNELRRNLSSMRGRAQKVWRAVDVALTDCVKTVNLDTSRHIQPDDQHTARERIVDALADAPHPTDFFSNSAAVLYRSDKAVEDILEFSRRGICEAVELKTQD